MIKKTSNINLANFLSFLRMLAAFPLIVCLNNIATSNNYYYYSIIIIIFILLSDILDGYFARKSNEITDLGKILDPVADKICLMVVLIYLIDVYHMPFLIFFILISIRDVLLISYTVYFIIFQGYVSEANNAGKLFISMASIMIIFYIFKFNETLCLIFYWLSIIMLLISTYKYIKIHNKRLVDYEVLK